MRIVGVVVVAVALVIGIVPQFTHCKAMSASSGSAMSMGSTTTTTGSSTATGGGTTMGSATATGAAATMGAGTAAAAQSTPMRCCWTARAAIGVALPLAAAGVLLFFSRRKETRRGLALLVSVLGVVTVLLPTVLIGVCQQSGAVCRTTMLPLMVAAGGFTIAIGLITLIRNELGGEPGFDGHAVAMQSAS